MDAGCTMPEGVAVTEPVFQNRADMLAQCLAGYSPEELSDMLSVKHSLAVENHLRYQDFPIAQTRRPAACMYSGMVFRQLDFESLSAEDMIYANDRMTICSFLYGILRPLDMINPYRLEGKVHLPCLDGESVMESWRPLLTDTLISTVREHSDGVLLNLASDEMRGLFDWKRVQRSVKVITPTFRVNRPSGPRTVTIYAKMCRGLMARYVIQHRIADKAALEAFDAQGFAFYGGDDSVMDFRVDMIK